MNICSTCREDFASVGSFDEHRVGVHDYLFAEGLDRDPPVYDGRRCLGVDELEAAGWKRDRYGRWRMPGERRFERVLDRVEAL